MIYQLKIYDEKGKLKKVLKPEEVERQSERNFLNQKSTLTTRKRIKDYREHKPLVQKRTKFYDKKCVVCGKEFHPRYSHTKYCSHECQKSLYLKRKKLENNQNFNNE